MNSRNQQKPALSMLRIVWHSPWASQINVYLLAIIATPTLTVPTTCTDHVFYAHAYKLPGRDRQTCIHCSSRIYDQSMMQRRCQVHAWYVLCRALVATTCKTCAKLIMYGHYVCALVNPYFKLWYMYIPNWDLNYSLPELHAIQVHVYKL